MKKIAMKIKETHPILLAFWGFSVAFLLAAVIAHDRANMFQGLYAIIMYPAQLTVDFFAVGGESATFLNVGLLGIVCCLLMSIPGYQISGASGIAYFLTTGFAFFGMSILNVWPCILGAFVYAGIKNQKLHTVVNFAIFATGLAPFVTDMLVRYPGLEVHEITRYGVGMALLVGGIFGFFTAAGCAHSINAHKGYSIYSAALPIGMMGLMMQSILYSTVGAEKPVIEAFLSDGYRLFCSIFGVVIFSLCIFWGFWVNGKSFKGFGKLLSDSGYKVDFTSKYGSGLALINLGVFGLFAIAYYNAIGINWTGPTIGVVFCMISTGFAGSHIRNVWPIVAGYLALSLFCEHEIYLQGIAVGVCFATGLSPISGRFGAIAGIVAGALHYCLVGSIPAFHAGMCLYNGGFTACFVALVFVPILECFCKTKEEKEEIRLALSKSE